MTTRNIVLIVLDTVRKDYFDKHARRLREQSDASFERCYAASSWTVPSHASMFTGQLLHQHDVHSHNPDYGQISTADTFLNELPHRSIGVSANSFLSPRFGFDRLFDEFASLHGNEELLVGGIDTADFMEQTDYEGVARYASYFTEAFRQSALTTSLVNASYMKLNNVLLNRNFPRISDYGGRTVTREATKRSVGNEPFFLFMNLVEAHQPHENLRPYDSSVPNTWTSREYGVWELNNDSLENYPEYLENFRELYEHSIEYLDNLVEGLIDQLEDKTDRPTTVIVTADHGEELGLLDEQGLGHKIPSTAVTHVPLEVFNPPEDAPSEVTDVVSLLDMGSLVTALAKGTFPNLKRERAPIERIGDVKPPATQQEFWNRGIRCVYDAHRKFEWDTTGKQCRYGVKTSQETLETSGVNIPKDCRELFNEDLIVYKDRASNDRQELADEMDDSTQRRLEDLGYM